jgi:hypothetical protein
MSYTVTSSTKTVVSEVGNSFISSSFLLWSKGCNLLLVGPLVVHGSLSCDNVDLVKFLYVLKQCLKILFMKSRILMTVFSFRSFSLL